MDDNAQAKKPKRKSKLILLFDVIFCVLIVAWIFSEVRWARINSPIGKFENVAEYLSAGRLPSRVTTVHLAGDSYWIAYAPIDFWLALPSSPPGYVFDETGLLVDWSSDPGDDPAFQEKWMNNQEESSLDVLKKLGDR